MAQYTLEIFHDAGEEHISKGETFAITANHAADAKEQARALLVTRGMPRLRSLTLTANNKLLAYVLDPEVYAELPVNSALKPYRLPKN